MKLSPLEQKILMNIQLHVGVICADMVDFRRPGHIYKLTGVIIRLI